jgi:NDP-sugar pyrophosphorylase family protein
VTGALPTTCILAGGRGTRLGALGDSTPKPLVTVAGKPFLVHQLELLEAHGARHVVLCVGFLGEKIEESLGRRHGRIAIDYSYDGPELAGTLGAVRRALPLLDEQFLILYGDTYLRVDYAAFAAKWRASGCPGAMAVLRNAGRWERSNARYSHGRVARYDKFAPTDDMAWIDYGLGGLDAEAVTLLPESVSDLAFLYRILADRGELFGFPVTKRFYDVGTPEALRKTERFLSATRGG